MKKWFFILQNALLSAACAVLFSTAFVACSDYQDDIDDLWDQVDKNTEELRNREAQLAKLQAAYDAGVVITSITSDNNGGIIVTTSSGDTYNIKKGDKGEQGQSITGPQGPIGPRGFVPTFSIDGNGNLIATWPEEADREPDNLGQVVSEIPELEFSINEEGHLIYNGQDLGNVIGPKGEDGETTVIDNKPTISFAITDAGNLTVTVDGETTDLGNVTGPQGPAGTLPSLSFSINDNGNLIAQFGNETIDCGQVKGEFKIENGGYYYNGEKLGDLTLTDVDFEVIDDYLYIAGNKTGYIMNQNIFLVDGEKTATLNLPVYNEDGEYEGQYQSVELLKAGSVLGDIEKINYKLLSMIQSIEFVPEFADPSVFRPMGYALQNVLYGEDGEVLQSSGMTLQFKVTPRAAAQVVADLFEQDPTAVTLHQQFFPWPTRD
ncbi:MAG: hypothetical protein IJS25_06970, partial [Bacteroidales bacterium]|nr:hypothetical protein [Bacteroidales bacterium]